MNPSSSLKTPASLLERLHNPDDSEAWNRFVDLYTPLIYRWARCFGLQEADVADLVQNVMLHLLKQMPTFHYQPDKRFRGWLWTVLRNKHREALRDRDPVDQASPEQLGNLAVPAEVSELAEEEYRQAVAQRALELMRQDFHPTTWQACWEHLVSGKSAEEVARDMGITPGAVRAAKFRVLCRLRAELGGLLD